MEKVNVSNANLRTYLHFCFDQQKVGSNSLDAYAFKSNKLIIFPVYLYVISVLFI